MNTEITTIMQVLCAWCGRYVKSKPCPAQPVRMAISHTVCPDCMQKMKAELERLKERSSELRYHAVGQERQ